MWARDSAVFLLFASVARCRPAAAAAPACSDSGSDPVHVTPECVDPVWDKIIIISTTNETDPLPHQKVSGHFVNTTTQVSIYLPPKDQWLGRFFHYVYPTSEVDADDDTLHFSLDSGAFHVQTSGQVGYRSNAAAAKFARQFAASYYDTSSHIYGYLFGGSGGSYQTIGALENTEKIWDGGVAFIVGTPEAQPTNFCVRALVGLALKSKAAQISDAASPGGSGHLYDGLSELQSSVLREATLMGIPARAWEDWDRVASTESLRLLNSTYRQKDPTYVDDFWTLPGYAGTEESELGDLIRSSLVSYTTTIERVEPAVANSSDTIILRGSPAIVDSMGVDFTVYDQAGAPLGIVWGVLDATQSALSLYPGSNSTVVGALVPGLTVTIDNRYFLALHTYHRHQVPAGHEFLELDQFRDDAGNPIYPQRSLILSESFAQTAGGGGTQTGNISAKLIAVDNLMDSDALPSQVVWYRDQVRSALGDAADDMFRLWYNDHANHDYDVTSTTHPSELVPFRGAVQYAVRELAEWVEEDTLPAGNTNFSISDQQISVPNTASGRLGIQPVAQLTVNGSDEATVGVGGVVAFKAHVEVPPGTSKIVDIEWDFVGGGNLVAHPVPFPAPSFDLEVHTTYNSTGTYLPAIRVTSQREGNASTQSAKAMNLGRARVLVE